MKKVVLKSILFFGFCFVLLEILFRSYLWYKKDLPFFLSPAKFHYYWYPPLKQLETEGVISQDVHILLLGGSVIQGVYNASPEFLERQFQVLYPQRKINIMNFGQPGHTSLDGYYKYQQTREQPFDLVIFYEAINEVRANNIDPAHFKEDYSHYAFYKNLKIYFESSFLRNQLFIVPFFIQRFGIALDHQWVHPKNYTPKFNPVASNTIYGGDIKTEKTFKENLKKIVGFSRVKKDKFLLMTFAHCKQEDVYHCPNRPLTQLWGNPANVEKGIEVHNLVMRQFAKANPDILFVDLEPSIPSHPDYYTDICHFKQPAIEIFVKQIIQTVAKVH